MNAVHRAIRTVTGGRLGDRIGSMPVIELVTVGRRSGRPHSVLLTSPVRLGDAWVVVASKGGDDRHPHWFLNLRANPEVEVVAGGRRTRARARVLDAAEKAEIWPRVVSAYRGYEGYQRRTDRDIPLVVLEPVREGSSAGDG